MYEEQGGSTKNIIIKLWGILRYLSGPLIRPVIQPHMTPSNNILARRACQDSDTYLDLRSDDPHTLTLSGLLPNLPHFRLNRILFHLELV